MVHIMIVSVNHTKRNASQDDVQLICSITTMQTNRRGQLERIVIVQ